MSGGMCLWYDLLIWCNFVFMDGETDQISFDCLLWPENLEILFHFSFHILLWFCVPWAVLTCQLFHSTDGKIRPWTMLVMLCLYQVKGLIYKYGSWCKWWGAKNELVSSIITAHALMPYFCILMCVIFNVRALRLVIMWVLTIGNHFFPDEVISGM